MDANNAHNAGKKRETTKTVKRRWGCCAVLAVMLCCAGCVGCGSTLVELAAAVVARAAVVAAACGDMVELAHAHLAHGHQIGD